jgi:hypothetical protein
MIVEITTFGLSAGADEAAFLEADARVQVEFFHRQPGMLSRTTARGPDGEWLVMTLWGAEADADASVGRAGDSEPARSFAALIESPATRRYRTLD